MNITDYNYDLTATARSGRLPKQSLIEVTTPFRMTGGAILDSSESINREDSELHFNQIDIRKKEDVPVFNYKLK